MFYHDGLANSRRYTPIGLTQLTEGAKLTVTPTKAWLDQKKRRLHCAGSLQCKLRIHLLNIGLIGNSQSDILSLVSAEMSSFGL